jgi:hypothetical protein
MAWRMAVKHGLSEQMKMIGSSRDSVYTLFSRLHILCGTGKERWNKGTTRNEEDGRANTRNEEEFIGISTYSSERSLQNHCICILMYDWPGPHCLLNEIECCSVHNFWLLNTEQQWYSSHHYSRFQRNMIFVFGPLIGEVLFFWTTHFYSCI